MDLIRGNGAGRYYQGKVTVNVDPLGLDRIQAHVPGMYDTDFGAVPWIMPMKFSPFGIGATWGVYGSPAVGSDVLILLQDGDGHYPMYLSSQTADSSGTFPSGTSWGFKDPYGNTLKMAADNTVQFSSGSGATVNISATGDVTINTPGDIDLTATGAVNVTASGDATVTASGNLALSGASISLN